MLSFRRNTSVKFISKQSETTLSIDDTQNVYGGLDYNKLQPEWNPDLDIWSIPFTDYYEDSIPTEFIYTENETN